MARMEFYRLITLSDRSYPTPDNFASVPTGEKSNCLIAHQIILNHCPILLAQQTTPIIALWRCIFEAPCCSVWILPISKALCPSKTYYAAGIWDLNLGPCEVELYSSFSFPEKGRTQSWKPWITHLVTKHTCLYRIQYLSFRVKAFWNLNWSFSERCIDEQFIHLKNQRDIRLDAQRFRYGHLRTPEWHNVWYLHLLALQFHLALQAIQLK